MATTHIYVRGNNNAGPFYLSESIANEEMEPTNSIFLAS